MISHVVTFPGGRPRDDDRERALRLAGSRADPLMKFSKRPVPSSIGLAIAVTKPRRPEPSKARECGTSEEV